MTGLEIHFNTVYVLNGSWLWNSWEKMCIIRSAFGLKVAASNKPANDYTFNVNKTTKGKEKISPSS